MKRALTHPRCLETDSLAALANRQLHGTTDDTALGCAFRLALPNEKPSLGAKVVAAFVTDEAALVPLTADGGDDYVVEDVLLAA